MDRCINCGSAAINPHLHRRNPNEDLDLCDVCYWKKRSDIYSLALFDMLDGQSNWYDIELNTGLSRSRCEEIEKLFLKLAYRRPLNPMLPLFDPQKTKEPK